jgi:hypothetical protein
VLIWRRWHLHRHNRTLLDAALVVEIIGMRASKLFGDLPLMRSSSPSAACFLAEGNKCESDALFMSHLTIARRHTLRLGCRSQSLLSPNPASAFRIQIRPIDQVFPPKASFSTELDGGHSVWRVSL